MKNAGYLVCFLLLTFFGAHAQKGFSLVETGNKKVEVRYDSKLLTAYCYFDSTEKPVLWPVKTLSGVTITRGYPVAPQVGERTDHPHHLGLWFNYESVNGLDFWNNSSSIKPERKPNYGSIRHQKILSSKTKGDKAMLETLSHWVNQTGDVLLHETTRFVFTRKDNDFIIDRIATLEAKVPVDFKDIKDGMLAIRVARELEMPSKEKSKFIDAGGKVSETPPADPAPVSGMYVNQEGVQGDEVWGKRSKWACLNGKKDGETISLVILDHPKNAGHPTYWHARGYGLFAANPLGQKIFSQGKEELNYALKPGEKGTFRFRVIVHSGSTLTSEEINQRAVEFAGLNY